MPHDQDSVAHDDEVKVPEFKLFEFGQLLTVALLVASEATDHDAAADDDS